MGVEQLCKSGDAPDTKSAGLEGENGQRMGGTIQSSKRIIADTDSSERPKGGMYQTKREKAKRHTGTRNAQGDQRGTWDNFPTQSPVCSRDDGLSSRLDGITFPKWRNESIKAYGNAIVPQVVFEIFKVIESMYL